MIRAIEIIEALGLENNEVKKLAPQYPKIKHPHLIALYWTENKNDEENDKFRPCKPYFDIDVFYRRYAFVAQRLLDLTLAESLIQKAIELDPNYGYSFSVLGDVLKDQHKYDLAIINYRKALHLDPDDCTYYAEIARCYLLKGDLEQAKRHWNFALEKDKDCKDLRFQYRWAGYLYWDNRFQEALQKTLFILKKNKHQIGCYLLRAMIMKHYPDDYEIKDILFWFEKYYVRPYLASISYYYCEYVIFLTDWGCEGDYSIIFTYFKEVVKHQVSYDLAQDDLYSLNMLQYAESPQNYSTYTSIEGHMKRVVDTWKKFELQLLFFYLFED
ncbi:hypothetical protein RFI_17669 [Reticulomyxa filosa]|uniref:Uncharacterized protein n=1 Tax=Reticulomyxa filosa TaxID=46433 RepID=X6N2M4_RETFI|nr:hypothetical protein RFI_17669 [Reticulomyxa filosa]|eukprot:ETO19562.1 hypothetical protein RFI_17669 [Reticulomyxa filosa]